MVYNLITLTKGGEYMAVWSKEVFAANLQRYMDAFGKNQKEIAEIAGVSAPTVHDWLKAKKYPRIDKIEILSEYFHILKSDLIEERSDEHIQMQKKNDTLANVIVRLRTDDSFLSVVEALYTIEDKEKLRSVEQMLSAFLK
jgi:transcriptional regulator with XRE-family HTH domain